MSNQPFNSLLLVHESQISAYFGDELDGFDSINIIIVSH